MPIQIYSASRRVLPLQGLGRGRIGGLAVVFVWFLVGDIAHFTATDTQIRIALL